MELPVNYNELHFSKRKAVREEYVRKQGGVCWYCKEPLAGPPCKRVESAWVNKGLFPEGFFNYPVHLHHNHDTGMTVGAIHCRCNAVLWQYYGE